MDEMQKLIQILNKATEEYDAGHPIMTDAEWDNYYFSLLSLERECGYAEPDSPTQKVIFKTVSKLRKVTHNHPMLSLNKTKSLDEVLDFITKSNSPSIAMLKMDGLTCSLHYENGILKSAETRGNGLVGEDILHNARVIPTIPQTIAYTDSITIDGEIICTYQDFEPFKSEFKHPRNFAAGSIRLLSSQQCAARSLSFVAWDIIGDVSYQGVTCKTLSDKLRILKDIGFIAVPYTIAVGSLDKCVAYLQDIAQDKSYPIDGIVFKYNNCEYYNSLGATEHHFRGGLAYKFYDELYETKLQDIVWTMGRTGVLTPVAVYDDVEIDGTICNRASLHNISIMKEQLTAPYRGEKIWMYRANQIIPQIAQHEFLESEYVEAVKLEPPQVCPICGAPTEIRQDNNSEVLYCSNEDCEGKLINRLDHFCGKKGLDIKGLSKAILNKLISWGWVESPISLFSLRDYAKEWISKPGFGEKSVSNILNAIDEASKPTFAQFISAIGIPLIGRTYAKKLNEYFTSYSEFRDAIQGGYDFSSIDGFGGQMHDAIVNFNYAIADELTERGLIQIKDNSEEETKGNKLEGLTFVITGKMKHYKNRDLLKTEIESYGGRVAPSVTSKTSYLINNDINSTSSKNETAKKLGVPIITEEDYLKLL